MCPAWGGSGCRPRASHRPPLTTKGRNILASLSGSLRSPTPPTRCLQYRPPLPRGHAPDDAVLLGGREPQRRSQARRYHWAARTHRQRPPLPEMQRPACRAVSRPEEHLRIHSPTRWPLPSDLLVRGEAINRTAGFERHLGYTAVSAAKPLTDLDHIGCDVLIGHNKPPVVNCKIISGHYRGLLDKTFIRAG